MSDVERCQSSRAYLAEVYADRAFKLAEAIKADPTAHLWSEFTDCSVAWNRLAEVDGMLRATIIGGDVIDDYYREGVVESERSYAEKVNALLPPEAIEALRQELASDNPARYRRSR